MNKPSLISQRKRLEKAVQEGFIDSFQEYKDIYAQFREIQNHSLSLCEKISKT